MAGHMEVTFEQKALGMVIGCRERDKRAVVVTIRKGGAAESLGVLPGMLIASVDGSAMTSFDEARAPRPVEERPGAAARAFRFWTSTVAPHGTTWTIAELSSTVSRTTAPSRRTTR